MAAPFPFDRLPRINRREAILLSRCARRLPRLEASQAIRTAQRLLGAPVWAEPLCWQAFSGTEADALLRDPVVAAVLENDGGDAAHRLAVDIAPQMAAVVVDRALGGDGGEQATARGVFAPDELSRGVLAYVIARLLHSGAGGWRLREIVTRAEAMKEALGPGPFGMWPVQVRIGAQTGTARLWMDEQAARKPGEPAPAALDAALLQARLTLVAKAGKASLKADEIASLQRSDVVLVDECRLLYGEDGWTGEIELGIEGARRARWSCTAGRRELRIESIHTSQEQPMKEGQTGKEGQTRFERSAGDLMKIAGDAPLEVTVELARFTLSLQQLAELRTGEVLLTGRPLGESVTLRAGGRALATGELVDVDGEVGVRVLSTGE